ncbi:MAG: hypothetical protein GXO15_03450 [Crenarchaeota archaeon]|nr:hypothetical protein [Thermoproteota archaeon]
MAGRVVVYIHPTCATSYELVKALAGEGLLDAVELRDTSSPGPVLRGAVWSVPWILVDGRPAATDPVSAEEAAEIIRGTWSRGVEDPVKAFMETVLHSAYAAALAYLHGSLRPVLDEALASAAVRAPLSGVEPRGVLEAVEAEAERLYGEWEDPIMRALGISYVREAWWASGGTLSRDQLRAAAAPEAVGAWLIAKASIGRAGLPPRPLPPRERVERLASFIQRAAAGLLNRVRREQEQILGDEEYWRLLAGKTGSTVGEGRG